MSVQLVAAISIEAVPLAALLAPQRVGVHDLGDALVTAEEFRHIGGQIDEHFPPARARGWLVQAYQHRLEGRLLSFAAYDAMRKEAPLRKSPQQLVELSRLVVGRRVNENVAVELRCLVDDFAGEL